MVEQHVGGRTAIARGEVADLILNVRNAGAVPGLPDDAVVEIPCTVDRAGPHARHLPAPEEHMLGLMQQVKAVERLVIEALTTRSESALLKAFALLDGYRRRSPEIGALFSD